MRSSGILLLSILLLSCGGSGAKKSTCYSLLTDKDTVHMSITTVNNDVKGSLEFNFYEKDRNTGALYGRMHGDTLIADYMFQSEGESSIREVAFLLKGKTATEGTGDMDESQGKFVFTHRNALNFSSGITLTEVNCEE